MEEHHNQNRRKENSVLQTPGGASTVFRFAAPICSNSPGSQELPEARIIRGNGEGPYSKH
jgi:hypothetical protein